jgi:hypothetical protein
VDTRDAYDAILTALGADPRKHIVESFFHEENFGNFWISFEDNGRPRTLVNDRGQLILGRGRLGREETTVVQSIREADERTLLQALYL